MPKLGDFPAGETLFLDANIFLEHLLRSVTPTQFRQAQRVSLRYHLLTNDALHVAALRAHRLRHLASADHDFRRVQGVTLWTP